MSTRDHRLEPFFYQTKKFGLLVSMFTSKRSILQKQKQNCKH